MSDVIRFLLETVIGELIIVVLGVLFATFIKSRYDEWRHGRWRVRILKNNQMLVDREISTRKAQEILEESADLAVFLKGVVSPYMWFKDFDIIEEGADSGFLEQDDQNRRFTLDIDKYLAYKQLNEPDKQPPSAEIPASRARFIVNFTRHPISAEQQAQLQSILTQDHLPDVRELPSSDQMLDDQPLSPQATALVNQFGLSDEEWLHAVIVPPSLAGVAAAVLAEIHGRVGHFPPIVRIQPIADTTPRQYKAAEIIDLQTIRDAARGEQPPTVKG